MDCFIHIGPSKTGSTSIQAFLKKNEQELYKNGICYLRLTKSNFREFRWAFSCEYINTRATQSLEITSENFEDKKNLFKKRIARKISKVKGQGLTRVIISCEGLGGLEEPEIQAMSKWMFKRFEEISIIPVLRRQDKRALSRYKNIVKNTGHLEQNCMVSEPNFDLEYLLKLWMDIFGKKNIKPILFPDSVPESRDLIKDFCAASEISNLLNILKIDGFRRNESIDGRAIEIMRQINLMKPDRHLVPMDKTQRRLNGIIENSFDVPLEMVQPSKKEARDFYETYKVSNEKVRQLFFQNREQLFLEDFDIYPEKAQYPEFQANDMLKILVKSFYSNP